MGRFDHEPQVTPEQGHFKRSIGLLPAVAVNMTQMCGIGPFVTIPLIVSAMGGPQAIFAFILGALISIADGMVWAELGAAMPGAGGTYLYLREAFQYTTGRLMPFLFIWTAMIGIPLIMSTGVIGLVNYLAYYYPPIQKAAPPEGAIPTWHDYIAVTPLGAAISFGIILLTVIALYRNISAIEKLTTFFFIVMLSTVAVVVIACLTHFHPELAFTFPPRAFEWPWHSGASATTQPDGTRGIFFLGLGVGLINAVYDYAGYNTTAYMGAEIKDPGRIIPRSIILSILGMMAIYLTLQIGVLGALPWQEIAKSNSIGALVLERIWGKTAAQLLTGLIVITAFASIVTGLLGGSRVPYNAARDKLFFPIFGRLHPRCNFPHIALLVMAAVMAIGSLFALDNVIAMLTAVMVLVQGIAQIAALNVLRRRQPMLRRPYKMFMYPLPSLIALAGWGYIYYSSGWLPIVLSLAWLLAGVIAFLIWARIEKTWPFGPKELREEFLTAPAASLTSPA